MSKGQKNIIIIEIVVLIVGVILFIIGSSNSGMGKRKVLINELDNINKELTKQKLIYKDNNVIVKLIQDKLNTVQEMLKRYQDKKAKIDDIEMEKRKLVIFKDGTNEFFDKCSKINCAIDDVNNFIKRVETYLNNNQKDLKAAKSSRKVSKITRKEIVALEKELNDGIERLKNELAKAKLPEDYIDVSLETLNLDQPLVNLKTKVNYAIDVINEVSRPKETPIIPIHIKPTEPKRKLVIRNGPTVLKKYIPDYPSEFRGHELFTIIAMDVDKDGKITSTSVFQSSGNKKFDEFCKKMAYNIKYQAATGYYRDDPGNIFTIKDDTKYPFKCK